MPGLALRLRRFVEIEGTQDATVLGAQAFTSLIPFLVVAAVFAPGDADLSERIVDRFGLEGESARSVGALFADSGEVEGTLTVISVVILVLATGAVLWPGRRSACCARGIGTGSCEEP